MTIAQKNAANMSDPRAPTYSAAPTHQGRGLPRDEGKDRGKIYGKLFLQGSWVVPGGILTDDWPRMA